MELHTGSAPIFFGTIFVVVPIGAFILLLFGRETVGQLTGATHRLFFRLASRSPYEPGRGNDNFDEMIWRDADPIKQESN